MLSHKKAQTVLNPFIVITTIVKQNYEADLLLNSYINDTDLSDLMRVRWTKSPLLHYISV